MNQFEKLFEEKISIVLGSKDPAHDLLHVKRVVKCAREMAIKERADLEVVLPAAWLHDIVNLPKDHKDRKSASKMAAIEAIMFLKNIGYPAKHFPGIVHAIEAHSFSSGIVAETIEAQIVQDADRLDALGAIGLARLFAISSQMGTSFYNEFDPFAEGRQLDDKKYAIDHIHIKLKQIANAMNTHTAKQMAQERFKFIEIYLKELSQEISN